MNAATVYLFYVIAPHIGILPVPNSPAFPDQASCEQALNKADPFLPGKTACWPAPFKYETGDVVINGKTGGAVTVPPGAGEHVD